MGAFKDILTFRRMVTPWIIQWAFWLLAIVIFIVGFRSIVGYGSVIFGVLSLLFGLLTARIALELIIVTFRIHDTLVAIKDKLSK